MLKKEIEKLKKEKDAVVLAHYYQKDNCQKYSYNEKQIAFHTD